MSWGWCVGGRASASFRSLLGPSEEGVSGGTCGGFPPEVGEFVGIHVGDQTGVFALLQPSSPSTGFFLGGSVQECDRGGRGYAGLRLGIMFSVATVEVFCRRISDCWCIAVWWRPVVFVGTGSFCTRRGPWAGRGGGWRSDFVGGDRRGDRQIMSLDRCSATAPQRQASLVVIC